MVSPSLLHAIVLGCSAALAAAMPSGLVSRQQRLLVRDGDEASTVSSPQEGNTEIRPCSQYIIGSGGRAPCSPAISQPPKSHLRPLSFDAHGQFKIAIVTDTHLLDGQNSSQILAAQSEAAVRTYLAQERPDFVVHLGDLVSGEAATSASDVEKAIVQILRPMRE